MNLSIIKTIFFKEIVDTLRDKRTLIAMIGVPILLYPGIFITASQVAIVQQTKVEAASSRVAIEGPDSAQIQSWLEGIRQVAITPSETPGPDLRAGKVDAVVVAEGSVDETLDGGGTVPLRIDFDSTKSSSRKAADRIEEGLAQQRVALLKSRLESRGLAESFAKPLDVKRVNVAPPAKTTGSILGGILPMLMIIMLGVGAFYPAVDLTAGEKERGTFETLLSTPTSKLEIVFGKFCAVCLLSIFTGALNLASMGATIWFQFSQIVNQLPQGSELRGGQLLSLPPQSLMAMVIILVPLAIMISAIMMAAAVLARSFKEAQNFVTPFFILITMPAAFGAIPDLDLPDSALLIPITNITILFRDLMMQEATLEGVFTVFVSTSLYAVLALLVATWIFQREEVILSEERGIPITFRRSEFQPRKAPTFGMALGLYALIMLLVFYAGAYVQGRDIVSGMAITQYGLILAPILLLLWFARIDIKSTLRLTRPSLGSLVAVLLLCPAWVVLSLQLLVWQEKFMPTPVGLLDVMQEFLDLADSPGGLALIIGLIGVSPGICEEALFRGAVLSGMRERLPAWVSVVIVGVLFGLFHLSVYRLVPQALTGIVLGYVVVRSGSIFPAVLMHLGFNTTLLLVQLGKLPQPVLDYLNDVALEENGLPVWMPIAASVVMLLGVALIEFSRKSQKA